MLGVVGSRLKMVKFEPTTPNMSQHGGQCCDINFCIGMLRSFGRYLSPSLQLMKLDRGSGSIRIVCGPVRRWGSCRFRPMTSSPPPSSPPHRLNLIEFAPNQIEFAPDHVRPQSDRAPFHVCEVLNSNLNSFEMKVNQISTCSSQACDVIGIR